METLTPCARASAAIATPRPELTWTMCSLACASFASSSARWMASSSATTGRESRNARDVRAVIRSASPRVISSLSAWTATGRSSLAASKAIEQRHVIGARELGQTRVAHERLESDDSPLGHVGHVRHGAGHQPAPQREVCNGRGLERGAFAIELAHVHRAWGRIERHVEEERAAAGRKRAASRRTAFPVRPAGLVEVQVHVDQARHHQQAAGIDLQPAASDVRRHLANAAILDRHVRSLLTARRHHCSSADDQICHAGVPAMSSSTARPTASAAATSSSSTASSGW